MVGLRAYRACSARSIGIAEGLAILRTCCTASGSERASYYWLCIGALRTQAAQAAGKWFLSMIAHGIVAALSLPLTALSATSLIDMQWNVVCAALPPHLARSQPLPYTWAGRAYPA